MPGPQRGPRGEKVTVVVWHPHCGCQWATKYCDEEHGSYRKLRVEVYAAAGTTGRASRHVSGKQRADELQAEGSIVVSISTHSVV